MLVYSSALLVCKTAGSSPITRLRSSPWAISVRYPRRLRLSFLLVAILSARLAAGGLILGILIVTVLGILLGEVTYQGVVSAPPSIAPLVGQIDIMAALNVSLVSVIFSILIVNLFDTTGTLVGVASNAGLVDEKGEYKNLVKH